MLISFSVMLTRLISKWSVTGAVSWLIRPLLRVRADLFLYLHRPEDSTPSEQIEGHLSEKSIQDVFDSPGKPGAKRMAVESRERSSMNEPGVIGVELNRFNRELSMLKRKPLFTLFLIVALQETLSQNAFAYLDPGTGSYIFQVLIAVFIGGLFTIKSYWQKIKDFFINRFSKRQEK